MPEVGALRSTGVTRLHHYYDPVRLPPPTATRRDVEARASPATGLPRCSNHSAYVPCPLPRRIGTGACVDCFPIPRGLPQTLGGSASALSFSRPAQASLALRPARLLNRPRRPLSRGFDGASCPATPPDSYQRNRQLAGWNPPPQVFRTFEAHQSYRMLRITIPECYRERHTWPERRHRGCRRTVGRVASNLHTGTRGMSDQ